MTIMYCISNHSCKGKSILNLVVFLYALKQVFCLYYIYQLRENLLLLVDNLLFSWEDFYNHSTLQPTQSQKQHFQSSQYLKNPKKNPEKALSSTSGQLHLCRDLEVRAGVLISQFFQALHTYMVLRSSLQCPSGKHDVF